MAGCSLLSRPSPAAPRPCWTLLAEAHQPLPGSLQQEYGDQREGVQQEQLEQPEEHPPQQEAMHKQVQVQTCGVVAAREHIGLRSVKAPPLAGFIVALEHTVWVRALGVAGGVTLGGRGRGRRRRRTCASALLLLLHVSGGGPRQLGGLGRRAPSTAAAAQAVVGVFVVHRCRQCSRHTPMPAPHRPPPTRRPFTPSQRSLHTWLTHNLLLPVARRGEALLSRHLRTSIPTGPCPPMPLSMMTAPCPSASCHRCQGRGRGPAAAVATPQVGASGGKRGRAGGRALPLSTMGEAHRGGHVCRSGTRCPRCSSPVCHQGMMVGGR